MLNPSEISDVLKQELENINSKVKFEEVGTVLTAGDGVAHVYGLENVRSNELVEFENGAKGVALNLEESNVGVVLLDRVNSITENMSVKRTGEVASIPVGEGLLGRVINMLGEPIDGKGPIEGDRILLPLERIAIDTIINQKANYEAGKPLYCIYVAIGQKASTVASIVNTLEKFGAMKYTVVVAANASESASMRYFAPFSGAAIGEYFRDTGRDALIIYDDLSKQAVAYREVSLVLKRPSGREAYPGDIFYLHSRLLERAARIISDQKVAEQMNDLPAVLKPMVKGGGSLTALPIIETQAGDVSAYIPTNVISITDGQIFLETSLFNQGIRPAINVGISVSRVGGSAQLKCMKKVAGTLKTDQAQFRELESFTKFGGDIDPVTARAIDRGRKNQQILCQPQYHPWPVENQVAVIYAGVNGLLENVPLESVHEFENQYLQALQMSHQADVLDVLKGGKLTPEAESAMTAVAKEVADRIASAK